MGIRENLQKMIDKKQQEIRELEQQLREANVYLQAVQDSMRLLPKDAAAVSLRAGTDLAKSYEAIKKHRSPMHIADILKAIGKPNDKKSVLSLNGTLSGYARQGKVFVKVAPHTFGLVEFGEIINAPRGGDPDPAEPELEGLTQ